MDDHQNQVLMQPDAAALQQQEQQLLQQQIQDEFRRFQIQELQLQTNQHAEQIAMQIQAPLEDQERDEIERDLGTRGDTKDYINRVANIIPFKSYVQSLTLDALQEGEKKARTAGNLKHEYTHALQLFLEMDKLSIDMQRQIRPLHESRFRIQDVAIDGDANFDVDVLFCKDNKDFYSCLLNLKRTICMSTFLIPEILPWGIELLKNEHIIEYKQEVGGEIEREDMDILENDIATFILEPPTLNINDIEDIFVHFLDIINDAETEDLRTPYSKMCESYTYSLFKKNYLD